MAIPVVFDVFGTCYDLVGTTLGPLRSAFPELDEKTARLVLTLWFHESQKTFSCKPQTYLRIREGYTAPQRNATD